MTLKGRKLTGKAQAFMLEGEWEKRFQRHQQLDTTHLIHRNREVSHIERA